MTGLLLAESKLKGGGVGNLGFLDRSQLLEQWGRILKRPVPPNTSQDMMRLIIGWEVQAQNARADVRTLSVAVRRLLKPNSTRARTIKSKEFIAWHASVTGLAGTHIQCGCVGQRVCIRWPFVWLVKPYSP